MLVRTPDDEGFGLVEVVVAFFILAMIAVAMLPGLWNGVLHSSEQASTATATRYLYALMERARENAANGIGGSALCTKLTTDSTALMPKDSSNAPLLAVSIDTCGVGSDGTVTIRLSTTAVGDTRRLASIDGLVYAP